MMHRRITPDHHEHGHEHAHGPAAPLPRGGMWLLAAAAAAVWAASAVYVVEPNQRAVVCRCGRILPGTQGPGLHVGLPYGLDRVTRLKMFEAKRVGIGLSLEQRSLGRAAEPRRAECLTGDRNLILVSAVVQYSISDVKDYLTMTTDVPSMIENLSTAALSAVISAMTVDDILTVGRLEIQQKVLAAVRDRLADLERAGQGLGVEINSVALEEVRPPQEVESAFRDVVAAREDRQRAVHVAEAYASGLIPTARGEAQRARLEAEGYAAEIAQQARGETDRFRRVIAELGRGRELAARRLILETLEEVMPRLKKIVLGNGPGKQRLDLGLIEDEP
jgi:membrane protease subunit HflK